LFQGESLNLGLFSPLFTLTLGFQPL